MITITIRTDNAAFEDDRGAEVARILRNLADQYAEADRAQFSKLYDSNGNAVGTVKDPRR